MKFDKVAVKKWLRILHRNLGFLMVGICLIYAVSGILLNHMDGKDPAYKSIEETIQFEKNLTREELSKLWETKQNLPLLKRVFVEDSTHYRLMLDGGIGIYSLQTGRADYEHHTKRQLVYWINKLHYNKVNGWSFMADFFAGSLIFFAISGLFIVSRKNGLLGKGKWYLIAGICIPIIYLIADNSL